MTTEKDSYEVDTSQAQEAFKGVAEAAEHAGHAQKSLGEQVEEMGTKFANHLLALETYVEVAKELKEWIIEDTEKFVHQEQAVLRLTASLNTAGRGAIAYKSALEEQAVAIEHLTGISEEHTMQVQALLVQYGVAPELLEKMTDAAYRLASATGQDATNAARMLARANAEGKEELKKYAISVDDAEFKAKGFAAVIEEVDRKFIKLSDSIPDSAKRVNELKVSWEELEKAIGGVVVKSTTYQQKQEDLARTFTMITRLINGEAIRTAAMSGEDHAQLLEKGQEMGKILVEGITKAYSTLHPGELLKKNRGEVELGEPEFPSGPLSDGSLEKQAEAYRKRQEQHKIFLQKQYEDERTARDEQEQLDAEANAKGFVTWKNVEDEHAHIKEAGDKALIELNKKWAEQEIKSSEDAARKEVETQKKLAEEVKQIKMGMVAEFKNYAQQILGALGQIAQEAILSNTKYNAAAHKLQVDREMLASKELGQNKSRADIEKQLADEHQASVAKQVAATLASIATQAGIKAIMEGVEAIAAAASEKYDSAGKHAAAAVGFAAVAVAAGGASYAISSGRGMTTDERSSLEDAERAKAESDSRNAQQSAKAGAKNVGTSINVYNLGISGLTEYAQGQELARIQDKYSDLKTGSAK